MFSIAVSPRDYQSYSHSSPSVFVQAASTEVLATTAARHVALAAVLQTRATLSTERVLVPLRSGKNQCVQVRHFWRIYNRVPMVMCTCILSSFFLNLRIRPETIICSLLLNLNICVKCMWNCPLLLLTWRTYWTKSMEFSIT